nr:TetR/AcrR family transcriptional regulator C-terminal domain-containing protein [uncultured Pseudomonas sp.]
MTSKTANPRGRRKKNAGEDAKSPLNKDAIITTALALIDREGLDKCSLRNLASSLGVYPTAIYWYVSSRELLLSEVLAKVLEHVAPEPQERWQDYLRAAMVNCHDAVHQHPNIAPLLGSQLVSNASTDFKLVEGVLAALQQAGFSGPSLAAAYNTFIAALAGFTTLEYAPLPENTEAWQYQVQESLRAVDAEQHPTLAQNMDQLSNRGFSLRWQNGVDAALDESFAFYVDTLLCGLETLAARR